MPTHLLQLRDAAATGDIATVRQLLRKYIDPSRITEVPQALSTPAPPATAASSNLSALDAAVRAGHSAVVRALLAASEASSRAKQSTSSMASTGWLTSVAPRHVFFAASRNHAPLLRSLLGLPADSMTAQALEEASSTDIHMGYSDSNGGYQTGGNSSEGKESTLTATQRLAVEVLEKHGLGWTWGPAGQAIARQRMTLAGARERRHKLSPLHQACEKNAVDSAAVLLACGADAGAQSLVGETPLHAAVRGIGLDCVKLLCGSRWQAVSRAGLETAVLALASDRVSGSSGGSEFTAAASAAVPSATGGGGFYATGEDAGVLERAKRRLQRARIVQNFGLKSQAGQTAEGLARALQRSEITRTLHQAAESAAVPAEESGSESEAPRAQLNTHASASPRRRGGAMSDVDDLFASASESERASSSLIVPLYEHRCRKPDDEASEIEDAFGAMISVPAFAAPLPTPKVSTRDLQRSINTVDMKADVQQSEALREAEARIQELEAISLSTETKLAAATHELSMSQQKFQEAQIRFEENLSSFHDSLKSEQERTAILACELEIAKQESQAAASVMHDDISRLQSEKAEAVAARESFEKQSLELQDTLESEQKRAASLARDLETVKQESEAAVRMMRDDISRMDSQKAESDAKRDFFEKQSSQLQDAVCSRDKKIADLNASAISLQAAYDSSNADLSSLSSAHVRDLEAAEARHHAAVDALNAQFAAQQLRFEEQHASTKKRLEETLHDVEVLRQEADLTRNDQVAGAEATMSRLATDLNSAMSELHDERQKLGEMQIDFDRIVAEKEVATAAAISRCTSAEHDLATAVATREQLQADLATTTDELESLRQINAQLTAAQSRAIADQELLAAETLSSERQKHAREIASIKQLLEQTAADNEIALAKEHLSLSALQTEAQSLRGKAQSAADDLAHFIAQGKADAHLHSQSLAREQEQLRLAELQIGELNAQLERAKEQSKSEHSQTQARLQQLEDQNSGLRAANERLETLCKKAENQFQQVSSEAISTSAELERAREALFDAENNCSSIAIRLEQLSADCKSKASQIEQLDAELESAKLTLNSRTIAASEQLENAVSRFERAEATIAEQDSQIVEALRKCKEHDQEVVEIKVEHDKIISTLREELDGALASANRAEERLFSLEQLRASQQEQIKDLTATIDCSGTKAEGQIAELEQQIEALRSKNNDLHAALDSVASEKQAVTEQQLRSTSALQAVIDEHSSKIEELGAELEASRQLAEDTRRKLEDTTAERSTLLADVEASVQKARAAVERSFASQEERLKDFQERLLTSEAQVSNLDELLSLTSSKNVALERDLSEANSALTQAQAALVATEDSMSGTLDELEQERLEARRLVEALSVADLKYGVLGVDAEKLTASVSQLHSELGLLKTQLELSESRCQELRQRLLSSDSELAKVREQQDTAVGTLRSELTAALTVARQSQVDVEGLTSSVEALELALDGAKTENIDISEKSEDFKRQAQALQRDLKDAKDEILSCRQMHEALLTTNAQDLEQQQRKVDKLTEALAEAQEQLAGYEKERAQRAQDVTAAAADVMNSPGGYSAIIQQYLKDNATLEEQLQDVQQRYFHTLAVSTKMNLLQAGQLTHNLSAGLLQDEAIEAKVPVARWASWITAKMTGKA